MSPFESNNNLREFVSGLPKAELHVHIEGTLEPELMFALAQKNGVELPFGSVAELRAAYEFDDLQSFLDIYYQGAAVLISEGDFAALMRAYLDRAVADGVVRAEVFFDPQTHTERGIAIGTVIGGFKTAIEEFADSISVGLIMSFLRHLSSADSIATFEAARPYLDDLIGIGLDSSEVGNPPERFIEVFDLGREAGLHLVAHAGEEAAPAYVWSALENLRVERIDHGVQSEHDPALVQHLADIQVPLTMCPLSNQKLQVFPDLADHNLKRLLEHGVKVTINSDDPAYFGGYVVDNYLAVAEALDLSRDQMVQVAANSIEASFVAEDRKVKMLEGMRAYVTGVRVRE